MFTDFGNKPLLKNWLPWQQRNLYLQFLNLKILLMPSYEKSSSFKVIACSVSGSSEPLTGLEVENTPPPVLIGSKIDVTLAILKSSGKILVKIDALNTSDREFF